MYFIPWYLRFLTLFFLSYFCLTGPFNYTSLYKSLLHLIYNPLCLTGLKALTNYLNFREIKFWSTVRPYQWQLTNKSDFSTHAWLLCCQLAMHAFPLWHFQTRPMYPLYLCFWSSFVSQTDACLQPPSLKSILKDRTLNLQHHKASWSWRRHWQWNRSRLLVLSAANCVCAKERQTERDWEIKSLCVWRVFVCMARVCLSKIILHDAFREWTTSWSAEEMLDGQGQRVAIPASAKSAHNSFPQTRLEENTTTNNNNNNNNNSASSRNEPYARRNG